MLAVITNLLGIAVFLGLAWALSMHRRRFPWRVVLWGLGLQTAFGILMLRTGAGQVVFGFAQRAVLKLNDFAMEGAALVFGPLAKTEALQSAFGQRTTSILMLLIASTIILVSSLSSLLYHWGVLQRVVHGIAWVMRRALRTTGSETLATAANIFIGQTEAPLVIKPYLAGMTRSELLALMIGGMATLAGGVLAVYAGFGRAAGFPEIAGHLLAASVMNAPAALIMAKILWPETEPSETASDAPLRFDRSTVNSMDALCRGASDGLNLALNVMAMLIAFVALVALANWLLSAATRWFGHAFTCQELLGYVNAPFAWLMGVPPKDCLVVGQILGERIVLNEFIGYLHLTEQKALLDERSLVLGTYALCGFANLGSVAIQVGGIGALVPERRADLSRLGLRAMVGGLLACYLTTAVVGLLL